MAARRTMTAMVTLMSVLLVPTETKLKLKLKRRVLPLKIMPLVRLMRLAQGV